jgi:hypothetical protein
MRRGRHFWVILPLLAGLLAVARGQQVQREPFTERPQWQRGPADAKADEVEHRLTNESAHSAPTSETIKLNVEIGGGASPSVHYVYPTRRAPLAEEFVGSVWVRATKPGIQLKARLVLPHMRNPDRPEEALTALIPGEMYESTGRWQRIELRNAVKAAKQEQQLMRARLGRDVDLTDAYFDQMILNLYTTPGPVQVWIDDLEIGPVLPESPSGRSTAATPTAPGVGPPRGAVTGAPRRGRGALVEINRDQLLIDGKRFFFRGIRQTDVPMELLATHGFNTVFIDGSSASNALDEASTRGLWVVPELPIGNNDRRGVPGSVASRSRDEGDSDGPGRLMSRFQINDRVLFWYLGAGRTSEQVELVSRSAQRIREIDANRPVAADVWDGHWPYSRNVDMLGAHRFPLMTGMELTRYRDWLVQRRNLALPGTFSWTWIQNHLPEWYTEVVHGRSADAAFNEPIGPQPEQIRLLTYVGLASGSRGLAYWSDRALADSHNGRDRLLAQALLNMELQFLEPILHSLIDAPTWIDTSNINVKAAVLRSEQGILVIPMWIGSGAQYVPGQSAQASLLVTVPAVPIGRMAWEVSPGEVRTLPQRRITGGVQVTIPEFNLTSAIVFTGDLVGIASHWQQQAGENAQKVATLSYNQAVAEYEKIKPIQEQLARSAPAVAGADELMYDSHRRLLKAKAALDGRDYRLAFLESQRSLRPLRILMRSQWEQAVAKLDTPVASPLAVSFYTLPRHWALMEGMRHSTPGPNSLSAGDFEAPLETSGWAIQQTTLDDVTLSARTISDKPHQGRQCLELRVMPRPGTPDKPAKTPAALERTLVSAISPVSRFSPGTMVRISGWLRVPQPIQASADGVLLFDSVGGEPLAVRLTDATEWKSFSLYRRVPANGEVYLTAALTGIGTAYFDDLRIEPMLPNRPAGSVLQP